MATIQRHHSRIDTAVEGLEHLSPPLLQELEELENQFKVKTPKLKDIVDRFQGELEEGLEKDGSYIPMNVTWTLGFPTGNEMSPFLTVDLSGTNLRICWITLNGREKDIEVNHSMYRLHQDVKTGNAEHLWALIADKVQDFIETNHLHSTGRDPLSLGFTFSYPATQDSVYHDVLQRRTKGWDVKCVEGEDAAAQLREAMEKRI